MTARLVLVGVIAILSHGIVDLGAYEVIEMIAPLWVWGSAMLGIAGGVVFAMLRDNSKLARMCVVATATVTGVIAFSMLGSVIASIGPATLLAPVLWGALAAKDLVVASMPYSTPLDVILADRPDLVIVLALLARNRAEDAHTLLVEELEHSVGYSPERLALLRADIRSLEEELTKLDRESVEETVDSKEE